MNQDDDTRQLEQALRGRYLIEAELGRGGMGIVYLTRDLTLERRVAIKLLPGHLARLPELRGRFLREARLAAGLSHPNIVPIHAVEETGSVVYFTMGYVAGGTLAARVRETGPLPAADVSRMMQEVAWALAYAHRQGVIHRDVKPENILLERGTQRALVTDFGIARLQESSGTTPAGDFMGTPRFASPEQAGGDPLDGRSDLYSLGVTAFYALTGRYPFEGESASALLVQHLTLPAPPVASVLPGVPPALAAAIDRCLAKAPSDRFDTGEALASSLSESAVVARVPRSLQQLSQELSAFSVDLVGFLTLAAIALFTQLLTRDFLGFGVLYTAAVGALLTSIIALRGIQASRLIREAALQGWTAADLALVAEREASERSTASRPPAPLGRTIGLYLAGVVVLALLWLGPKQWAYQVDSVFLSLLSELVSLGLPVALGRWFGGILDAPRQGRPGLLSSFFLKVKSGWLFRVLGAKSPTRSVAPPQADQPTELLLAEQARAMLLALPAAEQERLGAAGDLVNRLAREAAALRQRLRVLDEAAGAVGGTATADRRATGANIEEARIDVARRLGVTVSALDTVRLELLRARAGLGPAEGLTGDLSEVRRVAEQIDAALALRKR
jgi:serine/threonine-protein kinase